MLVSITQVLWHLLTSRSSLLLQAKGLPARPLQLWTYSFHLMPATFTPAVPCSYRTLVLFATSSTTKCLVCGFCTSDQMFASGFLQIPSRGGHPCLRLDASRYKGALGTFTH